MGNDEPHPDADVVRPRRHGITHVLVAVLVLCLAAASVLAWRLTSASTTHQRAGAAQAGGPAKNPSRRTPAGGSTAPGTQAPPATQTPVTQPATVSTTTSQGPLRVVEIGDSLGVDLGDAMENTWPPSSVQLTMAARGDTGLTNSAYYDWPDALAGLLASTRPQVVIVLLGANDLQSMVTGSAVLSDGTPAWNAAYAARVTAIISESVRAGAHVLWIGEPAMENTFLDAGMTRIDGIAQGVVARHPGDAAYLSANSVLAPNGSFTFDVSGPTGQQVQVRTPDGVHLMPVGADLLAAAAAEVLATTWDMHVTVP